MVAFSTLPIYLASSSPRRRSLLSQVGLPFTAMPSNLDEKLAEGSPEEIVQRLALDKAREVARRLGPSLVIGADTVVVLNGEILGKPSSPQEAREMLTRLGGVTHRVLTGLAVMEAPAGEALVGFEETLVTFRPLTETQISFYVATGEPMDKAGAYGAQGLGALLIKGIQGCHYNVVGLPLVKLDEMLSHWGAGILG